MPIYKFDFDLILKEGDRVFRHEGRTEVIAGNLPGSALVMLKNKYNIMDKSEILNIRIEIVKDIEYDNKIN